MNSKEKQNQGVNPFQKTACICTICEQEGAYRKLKSTLYTETKRDVDLRPIKIQWSQKVKLKVDPKLFYFWQCPFCTFTADHNFFLNHFKESGMSRGRFRKLYLRSRDTSESFSAVADILKLVPETETSAFLAGLKLNLMAIFIMEMIDEMVNADSYLLASYYLRLSWMFHELSAVRLKKKDVFLQAQQLLRHLQPVWPKICVSQGQALQRTYFYYNQALTKSPAVNTIIQEVQVRLIIIRIFIKLGKLVNAKKALLECRSRVSAYSHIVSKKSDSNGTFSDQEVYEMKQAQTKIQGMTSTVEVLFEKVESSHQAQVIEKAKGLLVGQETKSYEEKLMYLRAQKFSEETISRVLPLPKKNWLSKIKKSS